MKHIIVTTDFSTQAQSAFKVAREQAELYGSDNCTLSVINVMEDVVPLYGAEGDMPGISDVREKLQEYARRQVELEISEFFSGIKVEPVLLQHTRPVYQLITDYAREKQAHLIVIASHGRSGLEHFLVGSVAERVLRQAPCPVMVVPALG